VTVLNVTRWLRKSHDLASRPGKTPRPLDPSLARPAPLRRCLRPASIGLEAFSISALEAACTGLPLLLSDQVGLAGYLTDADAVVYPRATSPRSPPD